MAIGHGQALTGHGAAAVDVAAAAQAGAGGPDDLIQLSCQVSPDGLATVALRGDLDLATADRTVRYIADVIDHHDGPVSADLSELAFCDACGLGALIRVTAYAGQAGRRVELTSPSRAVARIMRLTGVDEWMLGPALAGASSNALAGASSGAPAPAAPRG
jgi:stage II sporulation protein AA (anti-sigma F factor antagonist)